MNRLPARCLSVALLTLSACRTTEPASGLRADEASPGAGPVEVTSRDGVAVPVAHLAPGNEPTPVCVEGAAPRLNEECKSPDEDKLSATITAAAVKFQAFQNPKPASGEADPTKILSKRDFHPKSTACVQATLVLEKGIPEDLHVGAFAAGDGHRYLAVVRYSNGSPAIRKDGSLGMQNDGVPDARAMAVKIFDVEGTQLLSTASAPRGRATQDFMMTNHPVFFLRNVQSAIRFFPGLLNGTSGQGLDDQERQALIQGRRVIADVFGERYWSQGAYRLGSLAVKYMVKPVACGAPALDRAPGGPEENFLRQNAHDRLATGDVCFDFLVQRQTDAVQMPVEDPTVVWDETQSVPVKVATLRIPGKQDVLSDARHSYCENLSFSPWNSVAEHRPLGSINRLRLTAYSGISNKRRTENQVDLKDPVSGDAAFKAFFGAR